MTYTVVFHVNEIRLLEIAQDKNDIKLTPKQLFEKELGWLEQSGIKPVEITQHK